MSERSPGFEDYIPSRLEWLALLLNSYARYSDSSVANNMRVERCYIPKNDGRTLLLLVNYPKDMDLNIIEDIIKEMERNTKRMIEIYKWGSWVEIEIDRHPK